MGFACALFDRKETKDTQVLYLYTKSCLFKMTVWSAGKANARYSSPDCPEHLSAKCSTQITTLCF